MNQIKATPFYIFTPECGVAWSHLVKPDDAFNKAPEWSVTLLLDPDSKETTRVFDEFEKGLEAWKAQLKAAFPTTTFKMGEHSRYGFTEFEGKNVMEIKCKKPVEAGQGVKRFANTPPILVDKYGTPIPTEEKEKYIGLGRGTTVQAKLRVQGYNHSTYGVGLTVQPEAIVIMNFVPYEKTTDLSGFNFEKKTATQDLTPSNVEDSFGGSTF
nr:single-stranded DNA-binding protein [uncultured Mediterranean phage uvMED]